MSGQNVRTSGPRFLLKNADSHVRIDVRNVSGHVRTCPADMVVRHRCASMSSPSRAPASSFPDKWTEVGMHQQRCVRPPFDMGARWNRAEHRMIPDIQTKHKISATIQPCLDQTNHAEMECDALAGRAFSIAEAARTSQPNVNVYRPRSHIPRAPITCAGEPSRSDPAQTKMNPKVPDTPAQTRTYEAAFIRTKIIRGEADPYPSRDMART